MRDYSKISPQFWIGSTGRKLRESGAEAMLVSLYLLSNPQANMLGLYYLPKIYIAHETGLGTEGASKGLRRAIEAEFCNYDEASEVVFVFEMARFQIADQLKPEDKRCMGIQREYNALPNNRFLSEFYKKYAAAFHLKSRRESTRFFEGTPKGHRSQEQEQEQEQEIKPSVASATVPDDFAPVMRIVAKEGDEKLPSQTDQDPAEIIPPHEPLPTLETPDGLHPNQYATRLLEEIRFPVVPQMILAIAEAIEREAKAMGLVGAHEFLVERTKFAIFEEHEINMSFFTEGRYRPEQRNGNQRQMSTQARPTGNTQRNIIPAARASAADTNRSNPTEAQLEELYKLYPRKREKLDAKKAIRKAVGVVMAGDPDHPAMPLEDALNYIAQRITLYAQCVQGCDPQFIPYPASWFNAGSFWDDERDWRSKQNRASDSNGATKLPPDYVPASVRIRQERDAPARGAQ